MRTWDEIRADWNNIELLKKSGRALFVTKLLKERKCSIKEASRELSVSTSYIKDCVDYTGFADAVTPVEGGGPRPLPMGGLPDVEFSGDNNRINEVVSKYDADEDEVVELMESGYTEPVARRLSRAAEAGRNTEAEVVGDKLVVHTEEEQQALDNIRGQAEALRTEYNIKAILGKYVEHSNQFLGHYLPSVQLEECRDPYIPKTLRRISRQLDQFANQWEAAISKEQVDDNMYN